MPSWEESVARYLSQLDTADRQEPTEALAAKVTRLTEKLTKLKEEMGKLAVPLCATSGHSLMRHRGVCSACTASRHRFERWSGSGRAAAHIMVDILRRATESPEPYVITALARRWSGGFSHSAIWMLLLITQWFSNMTEPDLPRPRQGRR